MSSKLTPEVTYALIKWATEDPESFHMFLEIAKAGGEPWAKLKALIKDLAERVRTREMVGQE